MALVHFLDFPMELKLAGLAKLDSEDFGLAKLVWMMILQNLCLMGQLLMVILEGCGNFNHFHHPQT